MGGGSVKKRRGRGERGGRCHAGGHKHKWSTVVQLDYQYYGKRGFPRPPRTRIATSFVNVGELDRRADKLIEDKVAKREKDRVVIEASKLGAALDITPETREDSIEVRLQPTGTVVGRCIRTSGTPCEEGGQLNLMMSLYPEVSEYTRVDYLDSRYGYYYRNFTQTGRQDDPPYPDGKFTLEYIIPGMPLGLSYGRTNSRDDRGVMTIEYEHDSPQLMQDVAECVAFVEKTAKALAG